MTKVPNKVTRLKNLPELLSQNTEASFYRQKIFQILLPISPYLHRRYRTVRYLIQTFLSWIRLPGKDLFPQIFLDPDQIGPRVDLTHHTLGKDGRHLGNIQLGIRVQCLNLEARHPIKIRECLHPMLSNSKLFLPGK